MKAGGRRCGGRNRDSGPRKPTIYYCVGKLELILATNHRPHSIHDARYLHLNLKSKLQEEGEVCDMERSFADHDIHRLGSKFDIEIVEEASYLVWYIWRDTKPSYSRLQDCITALTTDEELYRALKVAHAEGDYRAIREWKSTCRVMIVPN
jgi:hypothetical protein